MDWKILSLSLSTSLIIALTLYRCTFKKKQTQNFPKGKRKKKWTGWKPKIDEQTIEFRRDVMEKNDDKSDEDLVTFQKAIQIAAGEVAHHTKEERETCTEFAGKRQIT